MFRPDADEGLPLMSLATGWSVLMGHYREHYVSGEALHIHGHWCNSWFRDGLDGWLDWNEEADEDWLEVYLLSRVN